MRLHKLGSALILLGIAAAMAVCNLGAVARRSAIPLALAEQIATKEVRREKHAGKDDVCLLHFASGRSLHVDAAVYGLVEEGEVLEKVAWSTSLRHNGRDAALAWSTDFYGMLVGMPLILIITGATAYMAISYRA
jgi:hypothetical protein